MEKLIVLQNLQSNKHGGDTMKKLFFITFLFISLPLFSAPKKLTLNLDYPKPEFENAFIFDIQDRGIKNQYGVEVKHYAMIRNLTFDVFYHSPEGNEWINIGRTSLKGFLDGEKLGKVLNVSKYRYFAIKPAPQDENELKVYEKIKYQVAIQKANFQIWIRDINDKENLDPRPKHPAKNVYVMKRGEFPEDSDENIALRNFSSDPMVALAFFGYDKKRFEWVSFGALQALSGEGWKILDMRNNDLEDFDFVALVPGGGKKYTYSFSDERDDLRITVTDYFDMNNFFNEEEIR